MRTLQPLTRRARLASPLLATFAVVLGTITLAIAAPSAAPLAAPAASVLPTATCSLAGTTRSCDLYAMTGSETLSGTTVPIWGFASSSSGPATSPGPMIIANQGENLSITLHNVNLPDVLSLAFPLLDVAPPIVPDSAGITSGASTKTYSFTASSPGTYLYEAGLTADGPRQVAMGLFGGLVIRPSACANCAYDASSSYDDEALLVLSDLDPALNANPLAFDMSTYTPKYWLINGQVYPSVPPIAATGGHKQLLRYANAGLKHHSMALLGLHQSVVATDGKPLTNPYSVVAETVPTGGTLDTLTSIPSTAPAGSRYAVYDAANHLDNAGLLVTPGSPSSQIAFGGMLTFLSLSGSLNNPLGPLTSNTALTPNPTNGTVAVTLSADLSDGNQPAQNVDRAEYFADATGADGTGCAMTGSFGSPTVHVTATIPVSGGGAPCVDLTTLTTGSHTFFVHGHNVVGKWGGFGSAALNLDKTGPATRIDSFSPNPTNGLYDVTLLATGDDTSTGGSNVDMAEFWIDSGAHTALTQVTPAPPTLATQVHFSATIPAATIAALAEGNHTVSVRSHDVLNNWGAVTTVNLAVDKTPPAVNQVAATPNPTNGNIGVLVGDILAEKFSGTATDATSNGVVSNIAAAEGFIDAPGSTSTGSNTSTTLNDTTQAWNTNKWANFTVTILSGTGSGQTRVIVSNTVTQLTVTPAWTTTPDNTSAYLINGTGMVLLPSDGTWDQTTEPVYTTQNLYVIKALSEGQHTIYMHAQDAAGNWGPMGTTILTVTKTGPSISGFTVTPNPTGGASSVSLSATANATQANVTAAEWFIGPDQGAGTGTAIPVATPGSSVSLSATASVSSLPLGSYQISVRAKDSAGNWGAPATKLLQKLPADGIFADSFESGDTSAWSSSSGGTNVAVTRAAAMHTGNPAGSLGIFGMQVTLNGNTPGYVTYTDPSTESSYHARFYFNPNGTVTPSFHDIFVGRNAGGTTIFRIQYQRTSTGVTQVRFAALNPVGQSFSQWWPITNGPHALELSWQSATAAQVSLAVDGVVKQTFTLNSSANLLKSVLLGPSSSPPAAGLATGTSGTEYFDEFVSTRTTTIGP